MSYQQVSPDSNLALWQNSGIGAYEDVGDWSWEFFPFPYNFEAPADSAVQPPFGLGQTPTPTSGRRITGTPTSVSFNKHCPWGYYEFNGQCVPLGTQLRAGSTGVTGFGQPAPTSGQRVTVTPTGVAINKHCPWGYYEQNGQCIPTGSKMRAGSTGVSGVGDCGCGCGGGCGSNGLGQGLFNTGLFTSADPTTWGIGEWATVAVGLYLAGSLISDTGRAASASRRAAKKHRGKATFGGGALLTLAAAGGAYYFYQNAKQQQASPAVGS